MNIVGSPCAPPSNATGYVFNATVVPSGRLGFLSLWPDGEQMPVVSTLNAQDGVAASNMAIVPNVNGSTDALCRQWGDSAYPRYLRILRALANSRRKNTSKIPTPKSQAEIKNAVAVAPVRKESV